MKFIYQIRNLSNDETETLYKAFNHSRFLIVIISIAATIMGIFSNDGKGQFEYTSIRGKTIMIYGKGLYKDMSAEVENTKKSS